VTATRVRTALGAVGVLLALVGAYAFVTAVDPGQWVGAVAWVAAGIAAHDALLAPVALVVGFLLLPRLPGPARGPARGVLLHWPWSRSWPFPCSSLVGCGPDADDETLTAQGRPSRSDGCRHTGR
jgi:hypothetical protein